MTAPDRTALEQSFIDLCAKHDLTNIQVGINLWRCDEPRFSVSAQWDGYSRDGISCASAYAPTISEALSKALTEAKANRATPATTETLPDEPLTEAV